MKKYFLLLSLITSLISSAQIQKSWDKVLSSIYDEEPVLIYSNPSGTVDIIANVVGNNNSSAQGHDVTKAYGDYDIWFGKIDKNGKVISSLNQTYGDVLSDRAFAAIRTSDGGYVIGAITTGPNLPVDNTSSIKIFKIDTAGNVEWNQIINMHQYLTPSNRESSILPHMAICNTINGYCLATTVESYSPSNQFYTFLIHIDFSGNYSKPILQRETATFKNTLLVKTITQLSNGNLAIGGRDSESGFFLRTNSSGTVVLLGRQLGSYGTSEIIAIKELANGNCVYFSRSIHNDLTGSSRSVKSKASIGNYDLWVVQTNKDWSGVNFNTFLSEAAIGCGSLNLPNNSNFFLSNIYFKNDLAYILLESGAKGIDKTDDNKGNTDYWFLIYDYKTNKIVNQKSWGGKLTEQAQSIFVDDNKNVYLLGTSNSVKEGDKTETAMTGMRDLWVVKACLGVDKAEIANQVYIDGSGMNWIASCKGKAGYAAVKNPNPHYVYTWYKGTTLVGTGASFTTPNPLTANDTYTVKASNGSCESTTSVFFYLLDAPNPIISGKTSLCKGSPLFLTAKNLNANSNAANYYQTLWYEGGTLLHTGDTLSVASPTTTTYQVKTTHHLKSGTVHQICESDLITINVVVEDAPNPIVQFTQPNCKFDNTSISVSNGTGFTANWYDDKNNLVYTGNPYDYRAYDMTSTLFLQLSSPIGCLSTKEKIEVKVQHATPDQPAIVNSYYDYGVQFVPSCANSSALISVDSPNPTNTYNWYDSTFTLISSGTTYAIPSVLPTKHYKYHVSAYNGFCHSGKTDVRIEKIRTAGPPTIISTINNICFGDTLVLIAKKDTTTIAGALFKNRWYEGTTLLHTGDTLVIPNIKTTTTYSVATMDSIPAGIYQGLGAYVCEGVKTSKKITVDSSPLPQLAFTAPSCQYNSTKISVLNGVGYSIKWYDDANNILSSSNPFIYNSKTSKDSIYCKLINNIGCPSAAEKVIIEPQHATPPIPTIKGTYSVNSVEHLLTCENTKAILEISNSNYTYSWYSAVTGQAIANGSTYTTTIVSASVTPVYYVDANNSFCTSAKKQIVVDKIKTPSIPKISAPAKLCRGEGATLIATRDTAHQGGGTIVNVWTNSSNQFLHYGDSLIISSIQKTDKYYCYTMDSIPAGFYPGLNEFKCMSQTAVKEIKVDTVIIPNVLVPSPNCVGSNVYLKVSNLVNASANWYKVNGTYLGSGVAYTIMGIQHNDTLVCEAVGSNGCRSRTQFIVETEKPLALFTAIKTNLAPGDAVQFKDQSIGGGKTYWKFGDGNYSYTQHPYNYYNVPGQYTVMLISESPNGCVDTLVKKNYILVGNWIGIDEHALNSIKIYPNPFHDEISIYLPDEIKEASLTLYNTLGAVVFSKDNSPNATLHLETIPQGIYFLELKVNHIKHTIKLVKN